MNRLCIYVIYDKQNMVDRYIAYVLKALKSCVSHLVVVCNMPEISYGREYISTYADDVFFRENKGFDAGGYKDALCDFIGWDTVLQYDELVLMNDSFFGPFVPMKEIFDNMQEKKVDFWGLSKHKEKVLRNEEIPEHIQSFFLVVRTKLLHDSSFQQFWEAMPYYNRFIDVIRNFEYKFTPHFANNGFNYTCLADMKPNDTENKENTFIQYELLPYELLKQRNFPILKKKPMERRDILDKHTQENLPLVLDYIDKFTDYDVSMIWENIIRVFNISDLQKNMCLNYIVREQCNSEKVSVHIVLFARYLNAIESVTEYINAFKDEVEIYADTDEIRNRYEQLGFRVYKREDVCDQKRIEAWSKQKYICFVQDEDLSSDMQPSYHGKSLLFRTFENLLQSQNYVNGIVNVFENNPQLGVLTLPRANFGNLFGSVEAEWMKEYESITVVARKYGMAGQLRKDKPPFALFESFWIRGSVLRELESVEPNDYAKLPYLWGYIAQKAGFCSGIVENENYAAMNEVNMQYYLTELCQQVQQQLGSFSSFAELQMIICKQALEVYCAKHKTIFVYGTGEYAEKYSPYIANISAYVVSDGQSKASEFMGKQVLFLSEICARKDIGVVVCLDKNNQAKVVPLLEEAGITDYFLV